MTRRCQPSHSLCPRSCGSACTKPTIVQSSTHVFPHLLLHLLSHPNLTSSLYLQPSCYLFQKCIYQRRYHDNFKHSSKGRVWNQLSPARHVRHRLLHVHQQPHCVPQHPRSGIQEVNELGCIHCIPLSPSPSLFLFFTALMQDEVEASGESDFDQILFKLFSNLSVPFPSVSGVSVPNNTITVPMGSVFDLFGTVQIYSPNALMIANQKGKYL